MDNTDFKKIFVAHKVDVLDEGFSERIIRQLPERKSMLPQTVMVIFIAIGIVIVYIIHGFAPLLEQINNLAISISRYQIPSPSAIITYIYIMLLTVMIGVSVMQTDTE